MRRHIGGASMSVPIPGTRYPVRGWPWQSRSGLPRARIVCKDTMSLPRLPIPFVLLVGALACRPWGVAEPGYDAAAIVEGDAAPTVHTDTIDDPFTVRID